MDMGNIRRLGVCGGGGVGLGFRQTLNPKTLSPRIPKPEAWILRPELESL